jgi:serine/threonine protein kinase/Leucine-rich repeat (LRR) protein
MKVMLGPSLVESTIDLLLSCASECSNANALHELGKLFTCQERAQPNQTIIDVIQKKGFQLGTSLLVNAFIAGLEYMVRSLLNCGLILHPEVMAYTVLLAKVCQNETYPASLLKCLIEQEDTIQRPFQDRDKNEVYATCVKYCCRNDRDDLIEVFIKHVGHVPVEDAHCSSCIGRAMSRIGSQYYNASVSPDSSSTVKCGIISWESFSLTHLSGQWLTRENLGAFLVRLDVSRNKLSSLPFNVLDGTLPQLEEVDCSHNKLRSLWNDKDPIPIKNKFRLKVIKANNNEMETVSLHVFRIPSLEVINVSCNKLYNLPGPEVLIDTDNDSNENNWLCTQLKVLDVSHNKLKRLPEAFEKVLHLRKLNVRDNLLDRLPWTLCRDRFLEQVDLSCNKFGTAVDIYQVMICLPKYVQTLEISDNDLDEIPLSLAAMTSLRLLDCSKNRIASLPKKGEWSLPYLESFLVSYNKLGSNGDDLELPDSFSKSLTHLDLRHNQLKEFPKAILALKQIVYIELEGNPCIQRLPLELATLKRLWELTVDKMDECVRQLDPYANLGTDRIHFSRVKKTMRNIFYGYDSYSGVKLTVNGSEAARNSIIRGLNLQAGRLVSNLILPNRSTVRTGRLRVRSKSDLTTATFKVWNIPDAKSFLVLQHAFFSNNTAHLLVWHESDGLPGLDGLGEKLQLIKAEDSVLPILVVLSNKPIPQQTQSRLDEFGKHPGFRRQAIVQSQKGVSSLLEELRKVADNLTNVSHTYTGHSRNWVPSACREAANKLFSEPPAITNAVCGRKEIENKLFPAGLTDPDDFGQAMKFLVRIGGLLHFEDATQNIYEYFYINLDLISQIIVALTASRSNHLSSGVAHSRHIHAVFKQLSVPESDSNAFLTLLIKLGVAVPLDDCHSRFLLPFRLPSERNGLKLTLSHYLIPNDADPTNTTPTYVRRLYAIDGSLRSFWGQFISALVIDLQRTLDEKEKLGHKANSIFWASGIVSLYEDGCFVVNVITKDRSMAEYTKPIEKTKQSVENGLDIIVFDRSRRFTALGWICSHVERLLNEWNIVLGASSPSIFILETFVQRLIPYPPFHPDQIDDDTLNDFIFEHAIPETADHLHLEDCALATVQCSVITTSEGHTIDASQLAPDFSLKSLLPSKQLHEEDASASFSFQRKLRTGGFNTVLLGYYRNEKVAIKVFGTISQIEGKDTMQSKTNHFTSTVDHPRPQPWPDQTTCDFSKEAVYSGNTTHRQTNTEDTHLRATPTVKPSCSFDQLNSLVQEVSVMTQLTHKNIAQFKGVVFYPCPCLIMEFAPGGDLADLIVRHRDRLGPIDKLLNGEHFSADAHNGVLGRELTHRIAFQVALAIEYLHSKSICHLDIKPENVLVWSESLDVPVNVKLADYGISRTVTAGGVNAECGTPGYQAPEQILSRHSRGESFDLRVDIFAYGIMMYFALTGIHPFHKDMKDPFLVEHKLKARMNERPTLPTGQSLVYLQSLIDRCWQYRPSERPSAAQIVGEMCEPIFHIQCEDLFLSGKHQILATSIMEDNSGRARLESFDDSNSSPRSQTTGSNDLGDSDQVETVSMSSKAEDIRTPTPKSLHDEDTTTESMHSSDSLESELLGKFEELRRGSFGYSYPPPDDEQTKVLEDRNKNQEDNNISGDDKIPTSGGPPEAEGQVALFVGYLQPSFFALVATDDSLLVASPRFSQFLFAQKLNIREGDVSAMMFLNNRLWMGLRSELRSGQPAGLLYVFECFGGEIRRRAKQQTTSCGDVIDDIRCQFSSDRRHAVVIATLANGEIMIVHGEDKSTTNKDNSPWGEDETYYWNYPEVRQIGMVGRCLEAEDTVHAISRIVVTGPRELWYCQGDRILALDTQKPTEREPFKVISGQGSSNYTVSLHGIKIKDAVQLGDTVWCSSCQDNSQNVLQAVDVASKRLSGRWTVEQLVQSSPVPVTKEERVLHSGRLNRVTPKSVQCLTTVYDTLWVGCDNGAILVLHKKNRDSPLCLLATLWCREVLNHALFHNADELPSVVIKEMTQIGDRVLVYYASHPKKGNTVQQTTVAGVYLALRSSQIEELKTQYNVELA